MSNETEGQPVLLITVSGGIADWQSDDSIDIFHIDWDTMDELSLVDLEAKREELDDYEGQDWFEWVSKRLDRRIAQAREHEAEAKRLEDEQYEREVEAARQTLRKAGDRAFHERNAALAETDPAGALAILDANYHDGLPEGANCPLCGIEHAAINPSNLR